MDSRRLLLCTVLFAVSCGPPRAGDPCQSGAYCESAYQVLRCERGQLRALPCRGPAGCAITGNSLVYCDWASAVVAGDPCPYDQEGNGACSQADPKQFLQCTGGTMVLKQTCGNRCSTFDDKVGCLN